MRLRPASGWDEYTDLMEATDDPRSRAMIDNMRHHLKYECLQDPTIFETMVPDPEYRFYSCFDNAVLRGMDEVKAFYNALWESKSSIFQLHIEHCATADWGAACDGEWWQQVPGEVLIANGNADVEPGRWYLSHAHLSWFFPYREVDGTLLLEGEICYVDEANSTLTELDPSDVLGLDEARTMFPATELATIGRI